MKRNLRALALVLTVFAAFLFASASVATAQGHHDSRPGNSQSVDNQSGNSGSANSHAHNNSSTSLGSDNQPQPYSNADLNGDGANPGSTSNPNAYGSTRDGSPSLNGNGNGLATGKPCAGCVGKADNKNPPGQQPGGSDHNAGYECDRNKGIGQTNPAHTGCVTTTTEPTTTTTEPTTTTVPGTTTTSAGLTPQPGSQPQTGNAATASAASAHHGALAFTGFDSRLIGLGALSLIVAGMLLFLASSTTRRTDR